ncbi:MAG: DUF3109 family protein [Bacteroidota bacterium]
MIIIGNTLISEEIYTEHFICDIQKCKGECCVEGDAGAPLTKDESKILDKIFDTVKHYMRQEGIDEVKQHGKYCINANKEITTPLVNNKECAYVIFDKDNIAHCAIEKAYEDGLINFQKPISCHLYPIRIAEYSNYDGINYHRWQICKCAVKKGKKNKVLIYKFLEKPLTLKYGKEWYLQLDKYVKSLVSNKNS